MVKSCRKGLALGVALAAFSLVTLLGGGFEAKSSASSFGASASVAAASGQPASNGGEGKVGGGIWEALADQGQVRVVAALKEPASLRVASVQIPQKINDVGRVQEAVLANLSGAEFQVSHRFEAVPALAGHITEAGLRKLAADSNVIKIDLDAGGRGFLNDAIPIVKADQWQPLGVTGQGVTVAVIDSGIDTDHADLAGDLIAQACFLDNDGLIDGLGKCANGSDRQTGSGSAEDQAGHGTQVSGIITSKGTIAPKGVAPDAKVVAIRVLDEDGTFFSFSEIVAALDYILTSQANVRVVNMSLGTNALFSGDCDNAASFTIAGASVVRSLRIRTPNPVVVIAASGNDGSSTEMSAPGCLSEVLSVGATTNGDDIASFTNDNASTDLMAPGVGITTTGLNNAMVSGNGTSFAAPIVAGCAALLLQSNPGQTAVQLEARLKTSSITVIDAVSGLSFPRLDCSAQVASPTPAPSATPTSTPTPAPTVTPVPTATPSPTPAGVGIQQQLGQCFNVLQSAWGFNNIAKVWIYYFPGVSISFQTLTEFASGGGYIVFVSSQCSISAGPNLVVLSSGLNMFGWR